MLSAQVTFDISILWPWHKTSVFIYIFSTSTHWIHQIIVMNSYRRKYWHRKLATISTRTSLSRAHTPFASLPYLCALLRLCTHGLTVLPCENKIYGCEATVDFQFPISAKKTATLVALSAQWTQLFICSSLSTIHIHSEHMCLEFIFYFDLVAIFSYFSFFILLRSRYFLIFWTFLVISAACFYHDIFWISYYFHNDSHFIFCAIFELKLFFLHFS